MNSEIIDRELKCSELKITLLPHIVLFDHSICSLQSFEKLEIETTNC